MARYRAVPRSATIKQNMTNAGVPAVQQVWCHEIGGARLLHGVSITQRYPGHAVQAGHIAAQCGASAYASKYVVVVDDDVDVTNLDHLLWRCRRASIRRNRSNSSKGRGIYRPIRRCRPETRRRRYDFTPSR